MKRLSTYIWPTHQKGTTIQGNTSYHTDGRLPSKLDHILLTVMEYFPTFIQVGTHPTHNYERLPSRSKHILLIVMRDFGAYIWARGNTSLSRSRKALHLHASRQEHILLTVVMSRSWPRLHDVYIVINRGEELKAKAPQSIWLCVCFGNGDSFRWFIVPFGTL